MAIRAIYDPRLRKHHTRLRPKVRNHELMAFSRNLTLRKNDTAEKDQHHRLHSRLFSHSAARAAAHRTLSLLSDSVPADSYSSPGAYRATFCTDSPAFRCRRGHYQP